MSFDGPWKNQHGSLLELRVSGDRVSGRFESGVGDDTSVEIRGQVQDDLITFHASFPRQRALVCWLGQHTVADGVGVIQAQWLHTTNMADDLEEAWMWSANRIGFDTFTRA